MKGLRLLCAGWAGLALVIASASSAVVVVSGCGSGSDRPVMDAVQKEQLTGERDTTSEVYKKKFQKGKRGPRKSSDD